MSRTWDPDRPSTRKYLADELRSPARREYVGGVPYAMAGASNRHNLIATNTLVALAGRLRGKGCRAFNSDTKVRIRLPFQARFYYPDVSVVCRQNPQSDTYQDEPVVVVEVICPETRRIDESEKCLAYTTMPSLMAYVMVEQATARIVVVRRTADGFAREQFTGEDVVPLPEIGCELPLAEVYEGVDLGEHDDD